MVSTYRLLGTIGQRHEYFRDAQTPAVRLRPTPQTLQNLRRAGLLLKDTPAGLALLRDTSSPAGERPLPDFVFPLRFQVQPLSPQFENFTELPAAARPGTLYYFSPGPSADAAVVELRVEAAKRLPLRPLAFDLVPGSPGKVSLVDVMRGTKLPAPLPANEAGQLGLDLRPYGPGRYQLRRGAVVVYDFYADDQLYAAQTWGVLEIGAAALTGAPTLQLRFAARRTYWKYLIICRQPSADKYRKAPEQLSIMVSPDTAAQPRPAPVSFRRAGPLPTGVHALFVAEQPIALAERPAYQCKLQFQPPSPDGRPAPPTAVLALPRAGADLVRPAPAADQLPAGAAYSEILVHL